MAADFSPQAAGMVRPHARDLPWRGTRDPYAVWLSEIMLQQTQVETVKPYFQRFLAALPTIQALAKADEQQVLRLWEGLGYYRRARQLHQAARQIVADHDGRFPTDPQSVQRLPGIGRYTAGAILSIAFDQRQPILEANTVRVFSRLLAYDGQTTSSAGQKLLWAAAEAVLPARDVGRFNQALMELGSEVCRGTFAGLRSLPGSGSLPCPTPRAAKRDPSSQATDAIRECFRGGRARPPSRSRAPDPMARRTPLGGAVGFSPLCPPRRKSRRDPAGDCRQRAAFDRSDRRTRRASQDAAARRDPLSHHAGLLRRRVPVRERRRGGEPTAEVGSARRVGALSAQQHRPEIGRAGVG